MPIFNVTATVQFTMVVVANDEAHAEEVAQEHVRRALEDEPMCISVTGEVQAVSHLRDGWNGDCIPYGGDGNTRLNALLAPKG